MLNEPTLSFSTLLLGLSGAFFSFMASALTPHSVQGPFLYA